MSDTPPVVEKSEVSQNSRVSATPTPTRVSLFNLPQGIKTKDDLLSMCKTYGNATDAEFFPARPNKAAFGFVTYKSAEDAEFAIYRLDGSTQGGKVSIKAALAPERKREQSAPGQTREPKKRVKKPIIPLTVLTPKNQAINSPQTQTNEPIVTGKGWDMKPAQQPQQNQGQQKTRHPKNNGQAQGQKNPNNHPRGKGSPANNNSTPSANSSPAAANNAPANNASANNVPANNAPANNAPANNAPANNATASPAPLNNVPAATASATGSPVQNQNQNQNQAAKKPNQPKRGPKPAGQAAQQPAAQNNQAKPAQATTPTPQNQHHNQNQQNQTPSQNQSRPGPASKKPKKKKIAPEAQIRYRVSVADPKNNLPFHIIDLNQSQYDKFILPLVTKN